MPRWALVPRLRQHQARSLLPLPALTFLTPRGAPAASVRVWPAGMHRTPLIQVRCPLPSQQAGMAVESTAPSPDPEIGEGTPSWQGPQEVDR